MLDVILLLILVVGLIVGWWKGFFLQLASLIGAIAGFFIACFFYASFGEKLAPHIGASPTMSHVIAFVLLWILIPLAFTFVGKLLTGFFSKIKLGWLNNGLGALLGLFKTLLFASIFLSFFEFLNKFDANPLIEQGSKEKSYLYYPVQHFAGSLLPTSFFGGDAKCDDTAKSSADSQNNI